MTSELARPGIIPSVTAAEVVAHIQGAPNTVAAWCLADLRKTPNVWRLGGAIDNLRNIAKWNRRLEGEVIHDLVCVFYKTIHEGDIAALCASYEMLADISKHVPALDRPVLLEQLAEPLSSSEAKSLVVNYVADAQVALAGWVEQWNKLNEKKNLRYQRKMASLH